MSAMVRYNQKPSLGPSRVGVARLGEAPVVSGFPTADLEDKSAQTISRNNSLELGANLLAALIQKARGEGYVVKDQLNGAPMSLVSPSKAPPASGAVSFGDFLARETSQVSPNLLVAPLDQVLAYINGQPGELGIFVASGATKGPAAEQAAGNQTKMVVLGPRGGSMPYPAKYTQFGNADWQLRLAVYNTQQGASKGVLLDPSDYGPKDITDKWEVGNESDRTTKAFNSFIATTGIGAQVNPLFATGSSDDTDKAYAIVYKKLVDFTQPFVGDPAAVDNFVKMTAQELAPPTKMDMLKKNAFPITLAVLGAAGILYAVYKPAGKKAAANPAGKAAPSKGSMLLNALSGGNPIAAHDSVRREKELALPPATAPRSGKSRRKSR